MNSKTRGQMAYEAASKAQAVRVAHNGTDKPCIVYAPECRENLAFVVVMPLRADEVIDAALAEFIGLGK